MRVISGFLKGRRFKRFNNLGIRPTTDREKEMMFNWLQWSISNTSVLDLFSGCGSLGIEALSRGASRVVFVENSVNSMKTLKENLRNFDIIESVEIVQKDVFKFLSNYKGPAFDVIFIDPPFTKKIALEVLDTLVSSRAVKLGTQVILEATVHEWSQDPPACLKLVKDKKLGDKKVLCFRYEQ